MISSSVNSCCALTLLNLIVLPTADGNPALKIISKRLALVKRVLLKSILACKVPGLMFTEVKE